MRKEETSSGNGFLASLRRLGAGRRLRLCAMLSLIMLLAAVVPARADMFPQPSVVINLENAPEGRVYATLLSKEPTSGPYMAGEHLWDPELVNLAISEKIWQALNRYARQDGYYFLGFIQNITNSQTMTWEFYPPQDFKLLLYYPASETFLCSEAETRYVFNSTFTADCSGGSIRLIRTAPATAWVWGMGVRFLVTLVVELAVAVFLFKLREKHHLLIIAVTNLVTQTVLNYILMRFPPFSRLSWWSTWALLLAVCEIIVFILEAVIYTKALDEVDHPKTQLVFYAFVANVASIAVGILLGRLFPTVF